MDPEIRSRSWLITWPTSEGSLGCRKRKGCNKAQSSQTMRSKFEPQTADIAGSSNSVDPRPLHREEIVALLELPLPKPGAYRAGSQILER